MGKIDLHTHSSHSSDGEIDPEALVAMAADAGVTILSIADHNRASAVGAALEAGAKAGVRVVPAIEIECHLDGFEMHLLGHFIDHDDRRYGELWADIMEQERRSALRRIELVRRLGLELDVDEVLSHSKEGVVTGELLAEIALSKDRNRASPLLAPYLPGGARSDNPFVNFYWDYCSQGKPAYVKISFMTLREAASLVRDTGGLPSLAHPGNTLKNHKALFPALVAEGVMGVEAFSSYHSPEENRYWLERAVELDLVVTCGSDFHGKTKPAIKLGGHGGDDGESGYFAKMREKVRRLSPSAKAGR